jgi:serine/threonine protein kinase
MERFEILLPPLDKGSLGITYKAKRKQDRFIGCLKILDHIENPSEKSKLERDYKILSSIDHPNIIKIYETFWDSDQFCIFMEFSLKHSVVDLISQRLPEDKLRCLLKTISLSLSYVHDQGVIHLDLKPSNIFLATGDEPKIVNFCLAKATDQYMAPELRSGQAGTFASDV